ncbi:DUF1460 domain-containing protein [Nocardia sp. NPDC127526]|uniref:DUF1460 domain-containing protein n=1 Tax=Nocardia sp. NPDC127526 TaxID=3345393 RepID=UPI00362DF9A6
MHVIRRLLFVLLALAGCVALTLPAAQATPTVNLDDATARKLDEALAARAGAGGVSKGELAEVVSRQFLGTPYVANMLVGSANQPEQLVIDFRGLDCFTYLDYVAALSKSSDRAQFVQNVVQQRYVDGQIDFAHRKHFFTDWAQTSPVNAKDITAALSPNAVTVDKALNAKGDGSAYLPGLPVVQRGITYIPSRYVDQNLVGQLRNGDFIGAYTDLPGLDVTHTGLFAMTASGPVFRNASSLAANNKVVDSPFFDYVNSVPGIVVLRAE